MGWRPCVVQNITSTSRGRTLQPACTRWHVAQERPLVPCGVWKAFPRSTVPAVLTVPAVPAGLTKGKLFGSWPSWRAGPFELTLQENALQMTTVERTNTAGRGTSGARFLLMHILLGGKVDVS